MPGEEMSMGEYEEAYGDEPDMEDEPDEPMPVTKKTPIATIDCTPSWVSVVTVYVELLRQPEYQNRTLAAKWEQRIEMETEILRAAKLADLYVKEHKR